MATWEEKIREELENINESLEAVRIKQEFDEAILDNGIFIKAENIDCTDQTASENRVLRPIKQEGLLNEPTFCLSDTNSTFGCIYCHSTFGQYSILTAHLRKHAKRSSFAKVKKRRIAGRRKQHDEKSAIEKRVRNPSDLPINKIESKPSPFHPVELQSSNLKNEQQLDVPFSFKLDRHNNEEYLSVLPKRKSSSDLESRIEYQIANNSYGEQTESVVEVQSGALTIPGKKLNHKTCRKNSIECRICKKRVSHRGSLKNHMRIHSNDKPIDFGESGQSLSTGEERKLKSRSKSKNKHQECPDCKKILSNRTSLKNHMRIHSNDKPITCRECGKKMRSNQALDYHLRIHRGEGKAFKCQQCGKQLCTKTALYFHSNTHSKRRDFQCRQCPKKLTSAPALRYHLTTHSNNKPNICQVCDQSLSTKQSLIQHLRKHSREEPFGCDVCDRKFKAKAYLKLHEKIHDPGRKKSPKHKAKLSGRQVKLPFQNRPDKKSSNGRNMPIQIHEAKLSCEGESKLQAKLSPSAVFEEQSSDQRDELSSNNRDFPFKIHQVKSCVDESKLQTELTLPTDKRDGATFSCNSILPFKIHPAKPSRDDESKLQSNAVLFYRPSANDHDEKSWYVPIQSHQAESSCDDKSKLHTKLSPRAVSQRQSADERSKTSSDSRHVPIQIHPVKSSSDAKLSNPAVFCRQFANESNLYRLDVKRQSYGSQFANKQLASEILLSQQKELNSERRNEESRCISSEAKPSSNSETQMKKRRIIIENTCTSVKRKSSLPLKY